jgi:integrase
MSRSDTKNKQGHIIPLSTQAKSIVDHLLEQDGEYLIKTGLIGDKAINGFSKIKRQIDRLSGVEDWRIHDIRRTASTNLTKLGIDRFIVQKILNHSEKGATKIYDRYSYMDEKREALQKWADRLDEIVK